MCSISSECTQTSSPSLPSLLLRKVHDSRQQDTEVWHHLPLSLLHSGLLSSYQNIALLIVLLYLPLSFRAGTSILEEESCKGLCSSLHSHLKTSQQLSFPPFKVPAILSRSSQAVCFHIYNVNFHECSAYFSHFCLFCFISYTLLCCFINSHDFSISILLYY